MSDFVVINRKTFPLHSDGGTAVTTYEWACRWAQKNPSSCVTIFDVDILANYSQPASVEPNAMPRNLKIRKVGPILLFFSLLRMRRSLSRAYVTSAFQLYGPMAALAIGLLRLTGRRPKLYWGSHGSYDDLLVSCSIRKQLFFKAFDSLLARTADYYVANSSGEWAKIWRQVSRRVSKTVVFENSEPVNSLKYELAILGGGRSKVEIQEVWSKERDRTEKYLVFVGRFVRKKRLKESIALLDQWGVFERGYKLRIYHTNSDLLYVEECQNFINHAGLHNDVLILGPVYGLKKYEIIWGASAGILLSASEGSPMFLHECAMFKTPMIITAECNYRGSGVALLADQDSGSVLNFLSQSDRYKQWDW